MALCHVDLCNMLHFLLGEVGTSTIRMSRVAGYLRYTHFNVDVQGDVDYLFISVNFILILVIFHFFSDVCYI